jgi:plasmid stabilization system protein ParE
MAEVILSGPAAKKLLQIRKYYESFDVQVGNKAVGSIISAFQMLRTRPEIGRPWQGSLQRRELVIPFGNLGFVSLYQIDEVRERVVILAVRHQREDGYYEDPQ